MFLFISRNGEINLCGLEILRKTDIGHGYHCEPWVLKFVADNLRNLLAENVCDSFRATHDLRKDEGGGMRDEPETVRLTLHPSSFIPHPFLQFRGCDLFHHIGFNLVANLDVVKVLEADSAFKALANFGNVILEAPQGDDIALPTDYAVANQTGAGIAANVAVDHHRPGHSADTRNLEHFANICLADDLFTLDRLQHAYHRRAYFFFDLVNDRMETNIDGFLLGEVSGARFWSNVESNDYNSRGRRTSLRC